MLQKYPVEITLNILSYISIQGLASFPLISSDWNDFFIVNESSLYHSAALLHGFISSEDVSLVEAKSAYAHRAMANVTGWKEFCLSKFKSLIDVI